MSIRSNPIPIMFWLRRVQVHGFPPSSPELQVLFLRQLKSHRKYQVSVFMPVRRKTTAATWRWGVSRRRRDRALGSAIYDYNDDSSALAPAARLRATRHQRFLLPFSTVFWGPGRPGETPQRRTARAKPGVVRSRERATPHDKTKPPAAY